MQHWSKVDSEGPCPVGRYFHSAACLDYGGDNPQLVVAGGTGGDVLMVLSDVWILDVNSRRWRKVRIKVY